MAIIYTIGYGGSDPNAFFPFIEQAGIDVVVDVRTRPRGYIHAYTAPMIGKMLADLGIDYVNDKRLGGLDSVTHQEFIRGIKRVLAMSKDMRVCLMCSEKDPTKCHRYSKLSPELEARGAEMEHLVVGRAEPVKKSPQTSLF